MEKNPEPLRPTLESRIFQKRAEIKAATEIKMALLEDLSKAAERVDVLWLELYELVDLPAPEHFGKALRV